MAPPRSARTAQVTAIALVALSVTSAPSPPPPPELKCRPWCGSTTHRLDAICSWNICGACELCAASAASPNPPSPPPPPAASPPPICKETCARRTQGWDVLCNWKTCGGCTQCSGLNQQAWVECGRQGRCSESPRWADPAELHPVRCCSDLEKDPPWRKNKDCSVSYGAPKDWFQI